MDMPIVDLSDQGQPRALSEADRHLRGISTVLGKFLPELVRETENAAGITTVAIRETSTNLDNALADVSGQILGLSEAVQESVDELASAVRDLTTLVGEMQLFPRRRWSRTRQAIGWFRR